MSKPVVHITNLSLKYGTKTVLKDLNWSINRGDHWLLKGNSGSGKTSLAKAIAAELPCTGTIDINYDLSVKLPATAYYVANWYQFTDLEGESNFYYQQRYNSQATQVTATVKTELEAFGTEHQLNFQDVDSVVEALGFSELLSASLLQLSSGEHKKLQLIKALWLKPQLLILDQPYNGLDKLSRQNLNKILERICAEGTQLILISSDKEVPKNINHFAELADGQLHEILKTQFPEVEAVKITKPIPAFLKELPTSTFADDVIHMIDVNISYGDKKVLKNINWKVEKGEKWLLQGHNGSGKSTLLSLISGDHPQAYANNYYLFGQKRGSGESIWEIKERIGLISPELHWYFDASATVWQSIASGFFDSSGLFCDPGATKHAQVDELISYFDLDNYKNVLMNELPLGKQRLALLARTIIKNPELLILDEPCQGLDQQQTQHFNTLVDELCSSGTTLIYVGHFESQLPGCIEKRLLLENGSVKSVETILESI